MSLPETYRAWIWHSGQLPEGMKLEQRPLSQPQAGEVLIRNQAIGLNPVDWKLLNIKSGQVPGVDGAGTVVAIGSGVSADWLGQRVAWHQSLQRHGSFAEYTPLCAGVLMRIPDALGADQAAAFPCPGLTAWQALEKIPTRPGETILISGAGGSVGHYLVQLAAQRGFVVHTLSHPRHAGRLETLGATRALAEPEDRQAPWPVADRYYAIVDAVSDERCDWLCRQLRANGHFVAIQGRAQHWPNPPFAQAFSLHEVALGALHSWGDDRDWRHLTHHGETLLTWLADGSLSGESLVEAPFEQLNHSLARLKARNFSGKMIALFN